MSKLEGKGLTLNEIIEETQLPKITIYDHIQDILLSPEAKERIKLRKRAALRKLIGFNQKRKGKCLFGRVVPKPNGWTRESISLIAHFMFDGEVRRGSCVYQNRNIVLVNQVRRFMENVFRLMPYNKFYPESGVHRISYHYIELADYMRRKVQELKRYIKTASLSEKKVFLRAFFDDEGNVHKYKNIRTVRGYQYNLEILKLVQKLLKDFDIESKIDEKYKEIVISRKPNLIKFRDKINFSEGVYINPNRKNSIWKKKLGKKEILDKIINSYQRI